jgi:peroxiredoxin
MPRLPIALAVGLMLCPFAPAQETAPATAPAFPHIGAQAPDFTLPNLTSTDDAPVTLSDVISAHPLTVIIWSSTQCPVVQAYNSRINSVVSDYADRDVAFLIINSNATEPNDEIVSHAGRVGYTAPVLRDAGNVVADEYGAQRTPEVYVVDAHQNLRYHGRIDDSQDPARMHSQDLRNALDALLAGMDPPVTETIARGCTIKRVE